MVKEQSLETKEFKQRLKQGDKTASTEFANKYYQKLYKIALLSFKSTGRPRCCTGSFPQDL